MKNGLKNKKSFNRLYLNSYPMLVVYGRTIAADGHLIEDTIQELFVNLWIRRKQLKIRTTIESYLLVSFRNNLKKNLIKQAIILSLDSNLQQEEDLMPNLAHEDYLKHSLDELPLHQKEVIFLRYYKDMSFQDISEKLDISYQVARNFAYRGIKSLRKKMVLFVSANSKSS